MVGRKYFRTLGLCDPLSKAWTVDCLVASVEDTSVWVQSFQPLIRCSSWGGGMVASMFFNEVNFGESCPKQKGLKPRSAFALKLDQMTGGSPSAAGIGPWIIRRNLFYAKELNRLTSKDFQQSMQPRLYLRLRPLGLPRPSRHSSFGPA